MHLVSCEFGAAVRGGVLVPAPCSSRSSLPSLATEKRPAPAVKRRCAASSRRDDAEPGLGGGRLVDEGMVVLRQRIHEAHAAERNWEPPAGWATWEKEWYGAYHADVCHLVSALQALLLGARPAVGVGIVAAIALAVPASAFVVASSLLDRQQQTAVKGTASAPTLDAARGLIARLPH